ncbi:MAG: hypothetical protein ACLQM8_10645 [Limisphaerales bacterium]
MKILMTYPQNPDSFWSFKHVLRLVSKRSAPSSTSNRISEAIHYRSQDRQLWT